MTLLATLRGTILGVSVWGPGLEGWAASRTILAGAAPYEPRPSPPPPPQILPATERRRTGPVVRLALAVAHEAALASGLAPGALRSVFASSNGDGPVVGGILDGARGGRRRARGLADAVPQLGAQRRRRLLVDRHREPAAGDLLGCHDDTWAAGLLIGDGGAARRRGAPVLLCCYDHPLPPPLDAVRPTGPAFACALVLGADGGRPLLQVRHDADAAVPAAPTLADPALESLRRSNPAARVAAAAGRAGPRASRTGTSWPTWRGGSAWSCGPEPRSRR